MPRISEFYGIVIAMFHGDHNPPHFHAFYGEYKAQISTKNLKLIKGKLPNTAKSLVLKWAGIYQKELNEEWELARQHKPLFWIEPLK